jgi:hypothetical protein
MEQDDSLIEACNKWAASSTGEHEPPGPVIIGPSTMGDERRR